MKKHAEKKTAQHTTVALLVMILAVGSIGLVWWTRQKTAERVDESVEVESTSVEIPTEEETSATETGEELPMDDPQDDVPVAYAAYQGVVKELEATYGSAGSQMSTQGRFEFDASCYADLTGVCLLKLIDFNRDGLSELVAGYRAPSDGQYHFRVYGFSGGKLHLYLDALMGGNGEPEVYELATERLNDGQIYLITHDGITEHRVYGFDATGNFVPLIEIGQHRINGQPVYDNLVQKAIQEWISDEQTLYPMTMLFDADSALQAVQETKEDLVLGAERKDAEVESAQKMELPEDVDSSEAVGSEVENPSETEQQMLEAEHPTDAASEAGDEAEDSEEVEASKPWQYTAKQLIEQIHDVTDDSIADYLYEDFDGDGVKDIVALSVYCTPSTDAQPMPLTNRYMAPDGRNGRNNRDMRIGMGKNYCLSWWFNNGEEIYSFDSLEAPLVTGMKLLTLDTDAGLQLVSTVYWKKEERTGAEADKSEEGGSRDRVAHRAGAQGRIGTNENKDAGMSSGVSPRTSSTANVGANAGADAESTGMIYRFDASGVTELWREDGYRFSSPSHNLIRFANIVYTKDESGASVEHCTYGTLHYNVDDDSYQEFPF